MNDMILIFGKMIHVVTDAETFKDYSKVRNEDMPGKYERTHIVSDYIDDRIEKDGSFVYFKKGVVIYLAPESLDMNNAVNNTQVVTEASVEAAMVIYRQLGAVQEDVRISAVTTGYIADRLMGIIVKKIKENKSKEEAK